MTFDHPPSNAASATTVAEIAEIAGLIEEDHDLNVVVFDSANPAYYLTHDDGEAARGRAWAHVLARLSRAPVISIAAIRGRANGPGSELALACDLRFASREHTLIGPFEVDGGRGSAAVLARLVGRGRALEMLLGGPDLDGPRAEDYGYVDRLIADDRLDAEVDVVASRLALLDHHAIARTKACVDQARPPLGLIPLGGA